MTVHYMPRTLRIDQSTQLQARIPNLVTPSRRIRQRFGCSPCQIRAPVPFASQSPHDVNARSYQRIHHTPSRCGISFPTWHEATVERANQSGLSQVPRRTIRDLPTSTRGLGLYHETRGTLRKSASNYRKQRHTSRKTTRGHQSAIPSNL